MGVLQKLAFFIGLLVAAALMVPLIQSVDPEPAVNPVTESPLPRVVEDTDSVSAADELVVDSGSELHSQSQKLDSTKESGSVNTTPAPKQREQFEAPQLTTTAVNAEAAETLAQSNPVKDSTSAASDVESEGTIETTIVNVGSTDDIAPPAATVDRIFGPFESPGRAKRFAATFADKTGLEINTEKQANQGWFVTIEYSDEQDRARQRELIHSSTGLQLIASEK